ncbi:MAG: hypothetical protein AB1644_09285 [Candidatus Zixiibacteriota bacterium]
MNDSTSMSLVSGDPFLSHAGIELKRAERYRIFVSLVVIDLSGLENLLGGWSPDRLSGIEGAVRAHIRASDVVSFVDQSSLALLFPETSRQGAEAAGRRLTETIRKFVGESIGHAVDYVLPLEMASYPDAAGAKSLATFLGELAHKHRN